MRGNLFAVRRVDSGAYGSGASAGKRRIAEALIQTVWCLTCHRFAVARRLVFSFCYSLGQQTEQFKRNIRGGECRSARRIEGRRDFDNVRSDEIQVPQPAGNGVI